jgi:hypothetical protein
LIFVGVSSTVTLLGWWISYVSRYILSSIVTFGSYLLLAIFFYVIGTLDSCFEILIYTSISTISTSVVFTNWIISSKLIVLIENNFDSITKMIYIFSFVIPLW